MWTNGTSFSRCFKHCGAANISSPDLPIRLLITARDVAGALHLVEVARIAVRDPRFEVTVIAQEPAATRFAAAGIAARTVAWPTVTSASNPFADSLRSEARSLLDAIEPDVILTGLSTPFDASLDEAILAEARVPTALYQDFWGEQNLILGRGADHILAIDQQAAERNLARFGKPSIVVGSARHSAYATLDIDGCRARVRRSINASGEQHVIGFFGQALHALPGYRRTVTQFIDSVRTIKDVRLILRPHPRENAAQREETRSMFAKAGLDAAFVSDGAVEDALAACDVVVSLFSICTFDAAYLNRFASSPMAVPMSLLFDQEIAAYCRQHGNYFDFAHHTQGLVKPVYEAEQLPEALAQAVRPEARHEAWQRAHEFLPDPALAPQRVLDHMLSMARVTER
jgi:hypothetical protein